MLYNSKALKKRYNIIKINKRRKIHEKAIA